MTTNRDRHRPVRQSADSNPRTATSSPFFGPGQAAGASRPRWGTTPLAGPTPDQQPETTKAAVRTLMTDGSQRLAESLKANYPEANLCPIMRAGLGMLAGFQRHYPEAEVGFIGITSPKEIGRPAKLYLSSLPTSTAGQLTILLEPVVAEAKASLLAAREVTKRGGQVIVAALVSTRLGAKALADRDIPLYCNHYCQLNENGLLIPNLGDIGDRLWGEHEAV